MTDDGNADTLADPEGRPSGESLVKPPSATSCERFWVAAAWGRSGLHATCASIAFILHSQRTTQDRAQEQLHVQAWQLAQLVRQ